MLIKDKLRGQFPNFLEYCADAGKKFVHELRDEDFIAYRAEYFVSCEEVDALKNFLASVKFTDKICKLPAQILNKNIRPFIEAYNFNRNEKLKIPEPELTVTEFADYLAKNFADFDEKILNDFIDWLNFDINSVAEKLFAMTAKNKNEFAITLMRAEGKTLDVIGKRFSLTRERVRQIEKRFTDKFIKNFSSIWHNIFWCMYAFNGGKNFLTFDDVKNFIGEDYAKIIFYCLQKMTFDKTNFIYDAEFNAIIFSSGKQNVDVAEFKNYLSAEIVEEKIFVDAVKNFAHEKNFPLELLKAKLENIYQHTGKFFHSTKIYGNFKCAYILKNCFPNGYKIADATDFEMFNRYLKEFFGNEEFFSQRNLDARIGYIGVLCGRGKYIHRDFVHVPQEIINLIESFIADSPRNVLPFKEIFKALEDKLIGTQITNHYFLQGVIKLYELPYILIKDYLKKTDDTNIDEEFGAFVEERGEVTAQEIKQEFVGFDDHNIAFILTRYPEVIQIDTGIFMHSSQLDLRENDFERLENFLRQVCTNEPVTSRRIFDAFPEKLSDFLSRNKIYDHEKLFGILKYMFDDKFTFSRPYVSTAEFRNITGQKILLKCLEGTDEIEFGDLKNICEMHGIKFISNVMTAEILRPNFLRVDEFTLRRAESIGITDEIISAVFDLVKKSMARNGGWVAAKTFDDFECLPQLEISWTDFLLESVVAIAAEKIHVLKLPTSTSNFSTAIFVDENFAEDNFKSFLIKILRRENNRRPFQSQEEILIWMQKQGLCNKKLPKFLLDWRLKV